MPHTEQALSLAEQLHQSAAVRLVGIECYEGLAATGDSAHDVPYAQKLMALVQEVARACDVQDWFDADEVLLTAGGSAIFDLVAPGLKTVLKRRVTGLLRSGCYITHDQGSYRRMMSAVAERTGCGSGLAGCLRPWASVQSCPEPDLAILAVGKRDLSFDWAMPTPLRMYELRYAELERSRGRLVHHPAERPTRLPERRWPTTRRLAGRRTWSAWASRTPAPLSTNGDGYRWWMSSTTWWMRC